MSGLHGQENSHPWPLTNVAPCVRCRYCEEVGGWKLANMIPGGKTPVLSPDRLAALGFTMAAYPFALLSSSIAAYDRALAALQNGDAEPAGLELDFAELQRRVGFEEYWQEEARYGIRRADPGETQG